MGASKQYPNPILESDVAEKLCEAVGEVRKDVKPREVERGEVMRIRVQIDVTLLLCRGRVCSQEDGSKGWVSFKYERLPNVCYWCGCLNPFDKDCECWIQSNDTLQQEDQEYGSLLCVSPLPMHKNLVIVVPGYYETKRKELEAGSRKRVNG